MHVMSAQAWVSQAEKKEERERGSKGPLPGCSNFLRLGFSPQIRQRHSQKKAGCLLCARKPPPPLLLQVGARLVCPLPLCDLFCPAAACSAVYCR